MTDLGTVTSISSSSGGISTSSSPTDTSSGHSKKDVQCILDPSLVNADTLPLMKDVGLSIFASACSKNRGAFVLQPPDGNTYGCLTFPSNVLDIVGINTNHEGGKGRALKEKEESDKDDLNSTTTGEVDLADEDTLQPIFKVENAEAILKHYKDGNLTSSDAVELLNFLVTNVYESTPNVEMSPYACDTSGLVTLQCDASSQKPTTPKIRAVTMAGVFTPALWATGGQELTLDEASTFYTPQDYKEMKKLGLNTVQVPVPIKIFSDQYKHATEWKDLLMDILHDIRAEDLDIVLMLDQGDSPSEDVSGPVKEAALFCQDYNANHSDRAVIIAMTLPAMDVALLEAATTAAPDLNVWIPTKGGDFAILHSFVGSGAVAASLELSHTATVGDIASSTSQEDRAKLFYHESTACISRAPLEYSTCYQNMPVVVANGFDLAIDNCHLQDLGPATFKDYGQCDRFNETIDSAWWKEHRFSFAARQLYAYEQGAGWSFATWKLYDDDSTADEEEESEVGVLDVPAKLLALKEVVAAGIMPSLLDLDSPLTFPLSNQSSPVVGLACLNPPANDFVLGDATLAPTPAPPPDCGNGWWNFTTEQCDYWIPPTVAPCPVCSNDTIVVTEPSPDCPEPAPVDYADGTLVAASGDDEGSSGVAVKSFIAGAVVSALVCVIMGKLLGNFNKRRNYEPVANNSENGSNGQSGSGGGSNGNGAALYQGGYQA